MTTLPAAPLLVRGFLHYHVGWQARRQRSWVPRVLASLLSFVMLGAGLVLAALLLAVGSGGASFASQAGCARYTGIAPAAAFSSGADLALSEEQLRNGGTIVGVGERLGVPIRGWMIAIATALQESGLRNLNYGDRDSLGLFQQRPSQGWGTPAQILDPEYAAGEFYRRLLLVPGWESMRLTLAAQAVQRSAFPFAYARWEQLADAFVRGTGAGAYSCNPAALTQCPTTNLPAEAGLTPDALRVLRCAVAQFGVRDVGGRDTGGHIAHSDHYTGRAVDIMIPAWDTAAGRALGWRIAEWARANAGALGVTYVIFDRRIWSTARASEGWRPYTHPSGSNEPTLAHVDHVHVSVAGDAGTGSSGGGAVVGDWTLPLGAGSYRLTTGFGEARDYYAAGYHTGLDFAAPTGTPVLAASGGMVVSAGPAGAYGTLVKLRHAGGVETWYAHLSAVDVALGAVLSPGQVLGRVGATGQAFGAHLHLEVRLNGTPVDPAAWLRARGLQP